MWKASLVTGDLWCNMGEVFAVDKRTLMMKVNLFSPTEVVQDVASKGLSLTYQNTDESQKQALVAQIIDQLTSGKRAVAQVTEDTKLFEEGQLGTAPTGWVQLTFVFTLYIWNVVVFPL